MRKAIFIAAVGLALWACGETEPPEPPYVSSVTVEPDSVLVDFQKTATLTATVLDQYGETMQADVRWTSDDPDIATVDQTGVVTGRGPGATTVAATVGDVRGVAKVAGTPPYAASVTISPATLTLDFLEEGDLTATVLSQYGQAMTGVEVTWSSDDENIVRVDTMGRATGRGVGTARVIGTAAEPRGDVAGEAVVTGVLRQRGALMHIYESLNGPMWDENENWGTGAPLDDWFGVKTDDDGNVTELQMHDNYVWGVIRLEAAVLKYLQVFDFRENCIEGEFPVELTTIESLRMLSLSDNCIEGEIPPEIGNMQKLEFLDLAENYLSGEIPDELGDAQALADLRLYGNHDLVGPLPESIGNLPGLLQLRIQYTGLSGPLPRSLLNTSLITFHWYRTELCVPRDQAFRDWLDGIDWHRGGRNCN